MALWRTKIDLKWNSLTEGSKYRTWLKVLWKIYLQNKTDVAQLANICTHTICVEDEKNFQANNQCLQLESTSVIYCLGHWPWSSLSFTVPLALMSNQSAHRHPSSVHHSEIWQFPLPKHPKGEENTECKEKNNNENKTQIKLSGRTTLNSELDSDSVPVIHKYIKHMITIGTASKLQTVLRVQKACGANRRDDSRAR